MLLALGDDAFAPPMEKSLRDAGVTLHIVRAQTSRPASHSSVSSDDAENAITVAPGANAMLRGSRPAAARWRRLSAVAAGNSARDGERICAHRSRRHGVKVVLNAAPARELPASLLASVDVLIVNEGELATVAARDGAVAEVLATGSTCRCAVVTLGARGCCAPSAGRFICSQRFKVEPVDTTAAGDTFCGALAAALCSGSPLPQALRRASAAAALASTRLGAQSSIPAARRSGRVAAIAMPTAVPVPADELARLLRRAMIPAMMRPTHPLQVLARRSPGRICRCRARRRAGRSPSIGHWTIDVNAQRRRLDRAAARLAARAPGPHRLRRRAVSRSASCNGRSATSCTRR